MSISAANQLNGLAKMRAQGPLLATCYYLQKKVIQQRLQQVISFTKLSREDGEVVDGGVEAQNKARASFPLHPAAAQVATYWVGRNNTTSQSSQDRA